MAVDYSYEDTLPGQQMTKEERYERMIEYMNTVEDFNLHNGIKLLALADNYASCRVVAIADSRCCAANSLRAFDGERKRR